MVNTANEKKKIANEVRLFAEVITKNSSNIKRHEANNANNSFTYFLTITKITNGVTEKIKGNMILKRSWGSIFKKFLKRVGSMDILNAALRIWVGSGIQTDFSCVLEKKLYSLTISTPII